MMIKQNVVRFNSGTQSSNDNVGTNFDISKFNEIKSKYEKAQQKDKLALLKQLVQMCNTGLNTFKAKKDTANINLFTKMDLTNVCTVKNNTTGCVSSINHSVPFYLAYTIDPSGVLFGNSECGISNFENFLVPNPPPLLESGIGTQEKQKSCVKKCMN
jgi:hypothetical protein